MTNEKIVLSASRRTELLHFPDRFIEKLVRYPPERVHSIVLWTKTPHLLFSNSCKELFNRLLKYDQIYMHVTITGLGNTFLEPSILPYQETIDFLPKLIDVVKSPKRINIRFDPILNIEHENGTTLSNLNTFPIIALQCKEQGIDEFTISWITAYKKVKNRLGKLGFVNFDTDTHTQEKQADQLRTWAKNLDVNIKGCCTQPHFPCYGCINGKLLSELHPSNEKYTLKQPLGQRQLCECTTSFDIGWYYWCPNGCAYCYAQPKFDLNKSRTLMEKWIIQDTQHDCHSRLRCPEKP